MTAPLSPINDASELVLPHDAERQALALSQVPLANPRSRRSGNGANPALR